MPPPLRVKRTSQNAPLSDLVETLSWILGRPVVDQTGISGPLDYKLVDRAEKPGVN